MQESGSIPPFFVWRRGDFESAGSLYAPPKKYPCRFFAAAHSSSPFPKKPGLKPAGCTNAPNPNDSPSWRTARVSFYTAASFSAGCLSPSQWRQHKKRKAFCPSLGGMLEPENIFLLKLGLRVHKAGYGRSVSTALFLCRSVHRKFLNVIVIPLYGSSGRPAKLHALSGQQYKAVVRFSLPGRRLTYGPVQST